MDADIQVAVVYTFNIDLKVTGQAAGFSASVSCHTAHVKLLIILLKRQCARREHRQDHGNEQNRRKYPDYDLSGFLISKKVHSDQSVIF